MCEQTRFLHAFWRRDVYGAPIHLVCVCARGLHTFHKFNLDEFLPSLSRFQEDQAHLYLSWLNKFEGNRRLLIV